MPAYSEISEIMKEDSNALLDPKKPHPIITLKNLSEQWKLDLYSEAFSLELDDKNLWPHFREKFYYPKLKDLTKVDLTLVANPEDECIYLTGNSLGLQPKTARDYVNRQFDKWAKM